ncbi:MAG: thiosulfate oxidation carrier protein SoxY [Magnetococcales bacterium]|nr:thiosulfate oxidation carrier protein SoxY [Magnetococcales bacterium]
MSNVMDKPVSRRGLFSTVGRLGVTAALAGGVMSPTGVAVASGHEEKLNKSVERYMGAGEVTYEKVTIDAPIIAENGRVVPVKVTVDHPMTDDDFIESVGIFVDKNPIPFAARFRLKPGQAGKAVVATRLKIGKSSNLRAIARTNNGKLLGGLREIKVTIGGCGG